jgi:hypothetical protein
LKGQQGEQVNKTKQYLMGEIQDLEEMKKAMGQISKEDM